MESWPTPMRAYDLGGYAAIRYRGRSSGRPQIATVTERRRHIAVTGGAQPRLKAREWAEGGRLVDQCSVSVGISTILHAGRRSLSRQSVSAKPSGSGSFSVGAGQVRHLSLLRRVHGIALRTVDDVTQPSINALPLFPKACLNGSSDRSRIRHSFSSSEFP